jgi:pimeloyl-ACP methyl ester carboxylesterase
MDKLVICGHSFGGLTALLTAARLGPLCKAVCVMDPFLHAFEEECLNGELCIKHCPI